MEDDVANEKISLDNHSKKATENSILIPNTFGSIQQQSDHSICDETPSIHKIKASWEGPNDTLKYNTEEQLWGHLFTTKTQLLLDDFTLFKKNGNMIPLNDTEMKKARENDSSSGIYFSGTVKPLYLTNEDGSNSKFIGCCSNKIAEMTGGPIKEWWMKVDRENQLDLLLGITSELADYYLLTPSKNYQAIHEQQKLNIQSVIATNQVLHDLAYNSIPKVVEDRNHNENVDAVNELVRHLVLGTDRH